MSSSTAKYDAEPRPSSSGGSGRKDAKRRRASKKKNRRSDNNKPHRYPTRRELEGKNHANLERKLQEVRAAEERTRRRYGQLKLAETERAEDGSDRSSELETATTASYLDQQPQQRPDMEAKEVGKRRRADSVQVVCSCSSDSYT